MGSLRLLESSGDHGGMASVLDKSRSNPNRGFEWNFWMRRLHDATEEYTVDYSAPGKSEVGVVSRDGNQICLVDHRANMAAVIDRKSKRVVLSTSCRLKTI